MGLALFLRLWPIGHGFPTTAYVPDTHIVRGALGMAKDKSPVPPVGKYSTYPNLLQYMLVPVYGGQYALGRVTGEWGGAGEYGMRVLEEPARAHLPARILVALLSALAPWVVLVAGRAMGLRGGAWVAAYLVATGLLHVHFSVQERPWAPLVTCMALAAWPAALYLRSGRSLHLLLSGLAAALSFSCHQAGGGALAIPALAWLLGPPGWRGRELVERARRGFLCIGLFAVLALAVGHPYYLVHGLPERGSIAAGDALGSNAISIGGQALVFELRWETFIKLGRALVGYDPLLLLLGLLGLVSALKSRPARPALLFALAWAAFFMTNQGDHVRYLLPLVVLLAWPAGWASEWIGRGPKGRLVLGVLLLLPLVQALRLGWVLRREDTRSVAAARLLEEHSDAALAIDVSGPELPLNRASLERLATHRALGARERHRLEYWTVWEAEPPDGPGLDALPLEAIFDYYPRFGASEVEAEELERLSADPNEALRRLGRELVLVVDKTPDDGEPPILLDPAVSARDESGNPLPKMPPLELEGEPLWRVHPAGEGGRALDANLPSELTFPLTQIWMVERPGPKLELYRLAAD